MAFKLHKMLTCAKLKASSIPHYCTGPGTCGHASVQHQTVHGRMATPVLLGSDLLLAGPISGGRYGNG